MDVHIYGARKSADRDDLAKGIFDALQGIVYNNDRQVCEAQVRLQGCSRVYRRAEITVT